MRSFDPRNPASKPGSQTSAPALREDAGLERAADRVADSVLDTAAPAQDLLGSGVAAATPPAGGRPLTDADRSFFEPRLGWDFSNVRVHADAAAHARANALGTPAFTMGANIFLGPGAPAPGTDAGRRLMAHELAHVTQQQQSPAAPPIQRKGGSQPIRPTSTLVRKADSDTVSIQGIPFAIVRSTNGPLRPKGGKRDAFFEVPEAELRAQSRPGVSLNYSVTLEYENPQDELTVTYLPGRKQLETTVFPSVNCAVVVVGDQSEPAPEVAKAPQLDDNTRVQILGDEYAAQARALYKSLDGLWRKAKKLQFGTASRLTAGAFGITYGTGEHAVRLGLDVLDSAVQLATPVPDLMGKVTAGKHLASRGEEVKAIGRNASESWDIASGKTNDLYEKTTGPYKKFEDAYKAFNAAREAFNKRRDYVDGLEPLKNMTAALEDMKAAGKEYQALCIELGIPEQAARVDELDRAIVTGIQSAPVTVTRALLTANLAGELHGAVRTPTVKGPPTPSPQPPVVSRTTPPRTATAPKEAPVPASRSAGDVTAADRPSGVYPKYEAPKPRTEPQSQAIPVQQKRTAGSDVVVDGAPARTSPDVPKAMKDGGGSKPSVSTAPPGKVIPMAREAGRRGAGRPPPLPKGQGSPAQTPVESKKAANARVAADREKFLQSGGKIDKSKVADFETHHVATKYGEAGRRNAQLFKNAGLEKGVENRANKVSIEGHEGPHGPDYNNAVTTRLEKAVAGKTAGTKEYRDALLEELSRIKTEVAKKGTDLNDLVTRKR